MATISHKTQFWTYVEGIAPGQSRTQTYGPDVRYRNSTVQFHADPNPQVAGTTDVFRTQTLQVQPLKAITVPVPSPVGGQDFEDYVEVTITNVGSFTIAQFSLTQTVIGP
jgi:hypothetical protein